MTVLVLHLILFVVVVGAVVWGFLDSGAISPTFGHSWDFVDVFAIIIVLFVFAAVIGLMKQRRQKTLSATGTLLNDKNYNILFGGAKQLPASVALVVVGGAAIGFEAVHLFALLTSL